MPKNISFFSDFDSDLQGNGAFWGKVCSLEVVTNFEKLYLFFTRPLRPSAPRYRIVTFLVNKYIYWNIFGSWNIHIFLVPTQIFSAIAFICAEKMNLNPADSSNGLTSQVCTVRTRKTHCNVCAAVER